MKHLIFGLFFFATTFVAHAQRAGYWQQHVDYKMDVDMDVETFQFTGHQELIYTNNSPDEIDHVFYHLFFNAFQPGSMMDVRSRTISDPDSRVGDRIAYLTEDEIGMLLPVSLTQDGKSVEFEVRETILKVQLAKPLKPGKKTKLVMDFKGQVPVQIRRSGRNSREGIALSMAQWYPKLCAYDEDGWHPNPYVGREFYPVWGDFDVKITIDKNYTIGGTGYLKNKNQIGHGYEDQGVTVDHSGVDKLTWHFEAPNVHDFMWGADPGYTHTQAQVPDGPTLHFFYKGDDSTMVSNWTRLAEYTIKTFEFASKHYGKYPYKQYSVVQGGDGGMEYPMATLITGRRKIGSLVGVMVHEVMHSWYQGVLASNELRHAWFDEGFTTYTSTIIMDHLFPSEDEPRDVHQRSYASYLSIAGTADEDPLTTHGDHYQTNRGYGIASYSKGQVYLHQLGYIIGYDVLDKVLLRFFDEWKFKHPTPNDFLRVAERESGMVLDWYHEYFVHTTSTIDYGINQLEQVDDKTTLTLERIGRMPMPVEVSVQLRSGAEELHYIPMVMTHGQKTFNEAGATVITHGDWPWTHPTYSLELDHPVSAIQKIEIDSEMGTADTDRSNNMLLLKKGTEFFASPGN